MKNILTYLKSRLTRLQKDPQSWQHHVNMQKVRQRLDAE